MKCWSAPELTIPEMALSALVIVVAFLIGSIPFGLLIGKLNGLDIRDHGSGNIGATNVWRVCGSRWGFTCFLLDALKGYGPVTAVRLLVVPQAEHAELVLVLAAFATVAGHVWSPFLKFKGGKGIATSAGALLAAAPLPVVGALVVWLVVFLGSRYVSLASICAAVALPIIALLLNHWREDVYGLPIMVLLTLLCLVAVIRHRSNIKRLLAGTENRMGKKEQT